MLKSTEFRMLLAVLAGSSLMFVLSMTLAYILFAPGLSPDGLDLAPGLKATETLCIIALRCLTIIGSVLTLIGAAIFKLNNNLYILVIGLKTCIAGVVATLIFKIGLDLPSSI